MSADAMTTTASERTGLEVAIIGMAGRFPGASDIDSFWRNLLGGVESVTRWSKDELRNMGVTDDVLGAPDFVPAGAPLADSDRFDAAFFGYSPREAEILDPQQRLFLECAWTALENAGYAPDRYPGAIGVYASAGMNGYLFNVYGNAQVWASVTPYELFVANDKDFLATRAAYKLNLRGPCITVQTACSSSLVAVHLAVQSLLAGECDMALAGSAALSQQRGYRAREGSILSADGHCRAFDAKASGTVTGNGVAVVVLKRLEDAIADGDSIDAVILGSAVNNDGGLKASFTAPQVDSQAEVIAAAQAAAGVSPGSIGYIEAHGTGTVLGDPIEIAALTKAFRAKTDTRGFCAIGSVKTNIGHLDTAAGIAGLIKAALMLRHRQMPPSLHYEGSNPQIDFGSSPFFVNAFLRDWQAGDGPRRAGVSSFGIGGTNCHVVLQEAPEPEITEAASGPELLLFSARSATALAKATSALAVHLERRDAPALADVAHTLSEGRQPFAHRQFVVAGNAGEAVQRLRALADFSKAASDSRPDVVLLFPGQGSQYPGMGRALHAGMPAFREAFDACSARLDDLLRRDFRAWLFGDAQDIHQTVHTQSALFAVEYALGRLWMSLGVEPRALHGHSVGEYVAACLAGVFDLNTALRLVTERGRLMQAAKPGEMLSVMHPDGPIEPWLGGDIALAAVNAPGLSVVSGPGAAIAALELRLRQAGLIAKRLQTSRAFHSPMMAGSAAEFKDVVARASLNPPRIPVISNLTGTWMTDAQAIDPDYWVRHLLGTVRFGDGSATLLGLPRPVFIEAGPGRTLSVLTGQQAQGRAEIIPSLGEGAGGGEVTQILSAAGRFWQAGGTLGRKAFSSKDRRRVPLPTYPFESQRYWIEPDPVGTIAGAQPASAGLSDDPAAWFYRPSWRRAPAAAVQPGRGRRRWLIFDDGKLGRALAERLERSGEDSYRVIAGAEFAEPDYRCFSVADARPSDQKALLAALAEREAAPDHIVFLWPLDTRLGGSEFGPAQALHTLIDTLAANPRPMRLTVVTQGAADVTGSETLAPEQALIQGVLQVAGQEYPWLGCRLVDLDPDAAEPASALAERLQLELRMGSDIAAAFRARNRWVLGFAAHRLPDPQGNARLRRNGVFVVAGDLNGGLGKVWTEALAKLPGARLALLQDERTEAMPAPIGIEAMDRRLDCTSAEAMNAALSEVAEKWGRIDGVFLSTPMSNHQAVAPLALLAAAHWDYNHAAQIAPLRALAAAIADRTIGFCCVQSSLSSIVGGPTLAAYASAHHVVDSFAAARDREGRTPWFAINWDALDTEAPAGSGARHAKAANPFALTADEAWDCTRRILEAGLSSQTVVSKGDLHARRAEWLHSEPREEQKQAAGSGHQRPDLATPFVPARNEIEATVAGIFQELLGIDPVGMNDGFFELGGHSLLAIRAIARLREAFPVDVEMRELLFENPTVAGIARAIAARLPAQPDLDAMAQLLRQVEAMSEDEVSKHMPGGNVA